MSAKAARPSRPTFISLPLFSIFIFHKTCQISAQLSPRRWVTPIRVVFLMSVSLFPVALTILRSIPTNTRIILAVKSTADEKQKCNVRKHAADNTCNGTENTHHFVHNPRALQDGHKVWRARMRVSVPIGDELSVIQAPDITYCPDGIFGALRSRFHRERPRPRGCHTVRSRGCSCCRSDCSLLL